MISKEALLRQKFMPLRQRLEYLWNEHYIQISYGALRLLYKRHSIKHIKARRMRKSLIRDEDKHKKDRAKVAWELLSLLVNNDPVCYMDETTVEVNDLKTKTWQRED